MNWDKVVRDLSPGLYRFFNLKTDAVHASDLVQETLLRLYRKVAEGGFDPSLGKLNSFAYGIAFKVQLEFFGHVVNKGIQSKQFRQVLQVE